MFEKSIKMIKRNTNDPLLRIFLDRYNLHLLSTPRENAGVGDLYVYDGERVSTPGNVTHFLEPPFKMPDIITGEDMADVTGRVSNGISANVGLGLLENFLNAMGAIGIVNKVRASYETNGAKTLKFHFAQAKRDYVDVMLIGRELVNHRIMEEHALYSRGYYYYLVTAVVHSPSISIIAEDYNAKSMNIDLEGMKLLESSGGVLAEKSNDREVTFTGRKSLAFGVELYELRYDATRKTIKIHMPQDAIPMKGPPILKTTFSTPKPAFIGGTEGGVFINVQ